MRTERNLYSFLRRHQIILASVVLALFSLHLALTDKREYTRGYLMKEIFSVTLTPVQKAVLGTQDAISGVWNGYVALVGVNEENTGLKKSLAAALDENNKLKEELMQSSRLKSLLEYKDALSYSTYGAGIIGFNMDSWTRTIILDKGKAEGIEKDRAVISPQGVIGRTLDVNSHSSRVILTTDLRSNIDVIIQRTRVKGVAEGNGTDGLTLKYVRQVDDVRVGDILVTSGLSGTFPKGLIVGEVTKIEKGGDSFFKHIEVMPAVDMGRTEDALVIKEGSFYNE